MRALLVLLAVPVVAAAQAPTITSLNPLAVPPGATTNVTIGGANLGAVDTLWTSFPATATVDAGGRKPNAVTFAVEVPAEAPPGLHGVRVVGPNGLSAIKLFVVDDLASVRRAGGNESIEGAQSIETPVAVDGQVDGLTRQYFRFRAEAGQRLSFEVLARRIGSPLDPLIRLLDPRGRELVYSDDESGLVGDSRIRHEFTEAGEYVLELRDVRYQGGGGHFYRLRIGDFPCIDTPLPMAATTGTAVKLAFAGPHVDGLSAIDLETPKTPGPLPVSASFTPDGPSGFATLVVTESPQAFEVEPNNDLEHATRIEPGTGMNGLLGEPGDVDHFRFAAKKGEARRFAAITRREGSATDLVLRLLDATGKQLATADDTGTTDGLLAHTFAADGEYVLAVEDLNHRGGPRFAYRIAVDGAAPPFTLEVSADHVHVPAGGAGQVTVTATRSGYNGPIDLTAELPDGLTFGPAVIGPGRTSTVLAIASNGDAPNGLVPLRIVGHAPVGGSTFETPATATGAIRSGNAELPYPPAELVGATALAVTPAPPFTLSVSASEVHFGQQFGGTLKVVAHRREGFDEEIALAVEPATEGLPANVAAALKSIPKGANEVEIAFNGTDKAPLGRFSTVLRGTLKKDKATHTAFTPGIALTLGKPFAPTVEPAGGTLKKGGELRLTVTPNRNPGLDPRIEWTLENLPPGVTVAGFTEPTPDGRFTILLRAAPDAAAGEKTDVTVTGTATVGDKKLAEKSPAFTLKVE